MSDLELRDRIAVEAMKALILEPEWSGSVRGAAWAIAVRHGLTLDDATEQVYSVAAYAIADAMLAARGGDA